MASLMASYLTNILYPQASDRDAAVARLRGEIAALDFAIGTGVLTTSYDGKSATYDSFEEMKRRRGFLVNQLLSLAGPAGYRRPGAGFATFSRTSR